MILKNSYLNLIKLMCGVMIPLKGHQVFDHFHKAMKPIEFGLMA